MNDNKASGYKNVSKGIRKTVTYAEIFWGIPHCGG